jgi:hypothetical protein
MQNHSERPIRSLLFLGFFLTYAYFFQGGGWNQNVRFDQVWAIVLDGTPAIDDYIRESPNSGDTAFFGGHYYPNKPPGLSLLAVPVSAALLACEALFGVEAWETLIATHLNAHIITVLTVSALSAALMVVFYTALNWLRPSPPRQRLLVTAGYGLGTLAFPWSALFQAHQVSAALTFMVFALFLYLDFGRQKRPVNGHPGPVSLLNLDTLAGLCAGMAVMVDYSNLPVVVILAIYRLFGPRPGRAAASVALGMALPVALLLLYHWLSFGGPLTTSYRYENPEFVTVEGSVFGWPRLSVLLELSFKPYRGLFYSSPFLLLAIPGFLLFFRPRNGRLAEAAVCLAVVAWFFLFNASFINWGGGWCAGPRYLVPCLPFMSASIHFLWPRFRMLLLPLLLLSIVVQTAITSVNPCPSHRIPDPVADTLVRLADGQVSVNTQTLWEQRPPESIGLPVAPHHAWSSFNLGEVWGLEGLTSLVPLAIFWLLVFARLWAVSGRQTMPRIPGPTSG